jgi:outer membrane protein assembly factor BamB
MTLRSTSVIACVFTVAIVCSAITTVSAVPQPGWVTYRGNIGRSGYTIAPLPNKIEPLWVNSTIAGPSPAWPAPARGSYWQKLNKLTPRVTDDRTHHPVIVGERVLLASSTDDTVYCMDLTTGRTQWTFTTDGPVRYAPTVAGDFVYFGSDDGLVYCLALNTGRLIWSHLPGPDAQKIPGNGRLISRYPIRTGLVVDGGTVYACAGLFPSQGVYAAALRADTGEVIWKHRLNDRSPQGYMLATKDLLFVPMGRSNPFAIERATGKTVRDYKSVSGTVAIVTDDQLVATKKRDEGAALISSGQKDAAHLVNYPGRVMAVTPTHSYLINAGALMCLDRLRHSVVARESQAAHAELKKLGKVKTPQTGAVRAKINRLSEQAKACFAWSRAVGGGSAIIVSGDIVVVGGRNTVRGFDTKTGDMRWAHEIEGEAIGLASSGGLLVVTTGDGRVYAFGKRMSGKTVGIARPVITEPDTDDQIEKRATVMLAALPTRKGYAVVLGGESPKLVEALIRSSELQVTVICRDASTTAALRKRWIAAGVYGKRVSSLRVDDPQSAKPTFTEGFANLVVVDDKRWKPEQVKRLVAPYHGVAQLADGAIWRRGAVKGGGRWTHMYADLANSANGQDTYLTSRLDLQWFGGPGPNRMIDRHLRGPPPLSVGGRLFINGENVLIGCDANNGTELWELAMPDSQRYSMPYDCGYIAARTDAIFAAVRGECWILDTATGKPLKTIALPEQDKPALWGYVGIDGDDLYGSMMHPNAARLKPSRELIDADYRSHQPAVTSHTFFKCSAATGAIAWQHRGGAIVHATITIGGGRVYFVESRNDKSTAHKTGRILLSTLLASDAFLVALDANTGAKLWEKQLASAAAKNILYLSYDKERLILTGSSIASDKDAAYHLQALRADKGDAIWSVGHSNLKPNELFHGEQVHHPVILGNKLVAEPYIYDIASGKRINPNKNQDTPWTIKRPGHSCGTMSGTGNCVFFRAGNPTVLDLARNGEPGKRFTRLAPTRPGCWINIIPAGGLLLIPEASASCVCLFPLQTSMSFRPAAR